MIWTALLLTVYFFGAFLLIGALISELANREKIKDLEKIIETQKQMCDNYWIELRYASNRSDTMEMNINQDKRNMGAIVEKLLVILNNGKPVQVNWNPPAEVVMAEDEKGKDQIMYH